MWLCTRWKMHRNMMIMHCRFHQVFKIIRIRIYSVYLTDLFLSALCMAWFSVVWVIGMIPSSIYGPSKNYRHFICSTRELEKITWNKWKMGAKTINASGKHPPLCFEDHIWALLTSITNHLAFMSRVHKHSTQSQFHSMNPWNACESKYMGHRSHSSILVNFLPI